MLKEYLKAEQFASQLKFANISTDCDIDNRLNHRSTSLTPALSKLRIAFEKLRIEQIEEYITENIYNKTQIRFRKNDSTIEALEQLTETIRCKTDRKHHIAATFLDLSKAFESIDHENNGKTRKLAFHVFCQGHYITSILSDRFHCVTEHTVESD